MAIGTGPKPGAGATVSLIERYNKDSRESLKHLSYTIIGNSGDGKTKTALKLSKFWGKSKYLKDAVVVSYDHNGTNCIAEDGVRVDVVDVSEIMANEGINDVRVFEVQILIPLLWEYKNAGKTLFIFDTVTARAKRHLAAVDANLKVNDKGEKNKMDMWTSTTSETASFLHSIFAIPAVTSVFTGHSAVKEGKPMGDAEAKRIALLKKEHSDPERSTYGIDIPGKIGDPFINEVDVCLYVKTRMDPKAHKKEFYALVASGLGYRTKSKFEKFLGEGEHPADLGAIERVIRDGIEKAYRESEQEQEVG